MFKLNQCFALVALIFTLFLTACSTNIKGISPIEAAKLFEAKQVVMIDLRENEEWAAQHIEGAIHIPLAELERRLSQLTQFKDRPIVVQCRSGKRSAIAAAILQSSGFKTVYNLTGGILAWDKEKLATVRETTITQ